MIKRLSRGGAALLVFLIAVGSCSVWVSPLAVVHTAPLGGYTDVRLYTDIVARMRAGSGYYQAAASLQRMHHYPLKPFVTFRLPTLAELEMYLGWHVMSVFGTALLICTAIGLGEATKSRSSNIESAGVTLVAMVAGVNIAHFETLPIHEVWAGIILGSALAVRIIWRDRWWYPVLLVSAAMAVRELSIGFAIASAAFAIWQKRWPESFGWLGLLSAYSVGLFYHAIAVSQVVLPTDQVSVGWHGGLGFIGFLTAISDTSLLYHLGPRLGAQLAFLASLGWLALELESALFVLVLACGYGVMIAVFARSDTLYWGAILSPWYLSGLALLPRSIAHLIGIFRGERSLATDAVGCGVGLGSRTA